MKLVEDIREFESRIDFSVTKRLDSVLYSESLKAKRT